MIPRMNIFIGENSQSWNPVKAKQAIALEKTGVSPEDIWKKTGTVRGADGMLRQEISDAPAKFNTAQDLIEKANQIKLRNEDLKKIVSPVKNQKDLFPKQLTEARKPYKEEIKANENLLNKNYGLLDRPEIGNLAPLVVEHPDLYKAYPDMERIVINQGINKGAGNFGAYYPSPNLSADSLSVYRAALERTANGNPSWGGKSTSLHELQHAIQERENFAKGGSTDEMLRDLDKNTVNFSSNFDDTLQEPTVMPAYLPNLLVNGSSGIAVGMATNIPPHNLVEVIDGLIAMIKNPDITIEKLMK
jgi:hypothetical protein